MDWEGRFVEITWSVERYADGGFKWNVCVS